MMMKKNNNDPAGCGIIYILYISVDKFLDGWFWGQPKSSHRIPKNLQDAQQRSIG